MSLRVPCDAGAERGVDYLSRPVFLAHRSTSRHSQAGKPDTVQRGLGRSPRFCHAWTVFDWTPRRSALPALGALRSLPTPYRGYQFRSRTEARWAVFFDALGIKWDYEPEAFEFGGECYLPDFWLPDQRCWFEVKGARPTMEEQEKATWLAAGRWHNLFVVWGTPRCPDGTGGDDVPALGFFVGEAEFVTVDDCYWWCECLRCGALAMQYMGRAERIRCGCPKGGGRHYNYDSPRLQRAYEAARIAFTGAGWRPTPS